MNDQRRNADPGHIIEACVEACSEAIDQADKAAFHACSSIYGAFHDARAAGVLEELAAALNVRKKAVGDEGAVLRALSRRALGGRRQLAQLYGDALLYALHREIAPDKVGKFLRKHTIRGAASKYRRKVSETTADSQAAKSHRRPKRPTAVRNLNLIKRRLLGQRLSRFCSRDDDRARPVVAHLQLRVLADPSTGIVEVLKADFDVERPVAKNPRSGGADEAW